MAFNKPIKPAKDIDGVRRSAFWHLGRRDHSEQELRTKLGRKTDNQHWIDTVITECFEYNYLNDDRFIESFIRSSQNKSYGINRIKRDLKNKGIDSDKLALAFEDDQYDYVDNAVQLLSRKYQQHLANHHIKNKASAFLQGKGYNFDDIVKAIEIHNEAFPAVEVDVLEETTALLTKKFKDTITERKTQDKATRFLLSRGYAFQEIQDAIKNHNQLLNEND